MYQVIIYPSNDAPILACQGTLAECQQWVERARRNAHPMITSGRYHIITPDGRIWMGE